MIGVLEPSLPYPADTELIANVAASPHHLGATMVAQRTHRMTELFGRLAPGATVEQARAELEAAHAGDDAAASRAVRGRARASSCACVRCATQLTAPARSVLLLLLAAAGVVFAIACSNVANLILARTVRRERELAVRASLGASRGALRRTLLAESLVLCGTGALLGVLLAQSAREPRGRFAARFSVRALDVDGGPEPAVGRHRPRDGRGGGARLRAAPAVVAATRRPRSRGRRLAHHAGHERRLRAFAVAQIALSFVLLGGAGMLLAALVALQTARTGHDLRQVLARRRAAADRVVRPEGDRLLRGGDPPRSRSCRASSAWRRQLRPVARRRAYRARNCRSGRRLRPVAGEEDPHARLRIVSPGFFAALGVPLLAGRDFTEDDRGGSELVVIVSQSVAQRLFPNGSALDRPFWWTDPYFGKPSSAPHRRRRRGRGRRERRAGTGADDLSPVPAAAVRRAPLRPRVERSVRARASR